jgi:hypothetical protein
MFAFLSDEPVFAQADLDDAEISMEVKVRC